MSDNTNDRLVKLLARLVGVCDGPGVRHGFPYPEVMTDDDQRQRYPLTEEGAAVVSECRQALFEMGQEPIPLKQIGS